MGMNRRFIEEKINELLWDRRSLVIPGGFLVLLALVAMRSLLATPPISTVEQARLALSKARRAEANRYAPALLWTAENSWEQATSAWRYENKKWFVRRDFQATLDFAMAVRTQARRAESTAVATRDSLQLVAAAGITLVKQKIDEFKTRFTRVPVEVPLRLKFVAGELLMLESEFAFNRRDYWLATAKVQQAGVLVGSAGTDAAEILQVYLAHIPEWKQWAAEAIAWSAQQNTAAIVVDKMAHRCQVYLAGRLNAEYAIDLGPRWLGHKKQKGDGATPEGHYHVTKKKGPSQTKYHKALELDYPNENDRQQFIEAQKKGELSRFAHIGGLIEIHGEGGKGVNWTSGCVALRNRDMDEVFALADVGTRVTIVGSLKWLPSADQHPMVLAKKHRDGEKSAPGSSP